jgi:hypothetical protein
MQWKKILLEGKVAGRLLYREVKIILKTRVYVDLTRTAVLGLKVTKYVHIKSTTVYAPRRNWDSPNPLAAG